MTKYQIRVIVEETNGDIRNTILDISVFDTDSIAESINQAQKLIKRAERKPNGPRSKK